MEGGIDTSENGSVYDDLYLDGPMESCHPFKVQLPKQLGRAESESADGQ